MELLAALPRLGEDDVLAVPVGSGAALPPWLTSPAPGTPAPVPLRLLEGALADTGNTGRPAAVTNLPVHGRRWRSLVAVGSGDGTLPHLRGYDAT
ncbi:MAG TPA: peptidase M17, partial [Geodermatophilus sp.]|nr:peptidase M17 [Geodermatophilus sp.]